MSKKNTNISDCDVCTSELKRSLVFQKCYICGEDKIESPSAHIQSKHSEYIQVKKSFDCNDFRNSTTNKNQYSILLGSIVPNNIFNSKLCDFKSNRSDLFLYHLHNHCNDQYKNIQVFDKYKCPHCEYESFTKTNLRIHLVGKHHKETKKPRDEEQKKSLSSGIPLKENEEKYILIDNSMNDLLNWTNKTPEPFTPTITPLIDNSMDDLLNWTNKTPEQVTSIDNNSLLNSPPVTPNNNNSLLNSPPDIPNNNNSLLDLLLNWTNKTPEPFTPTITPLKENEENSTLVDNSLLDLLLNKTPEQVTSIDNNSLLNSPPIIPPSAYTKKLFVNKNRKNEDDRDDNPKNPKKPKPNTDGKRKSKRNSKRKSKSKRNSKRNSKRKSKRKSKRNSKRNSKRKSKRNSKRKSKRNSRRNSKRKSKRNSRRNSKRNSKRK